jgi:glycosyltransferase involved in cell wall biosynthesis
MLDVFKRAFGYLSTDPPSHFSLDGFTYNPPAESERYCFDVSDLIQYFFRARVATGIQRVQIRILQSLIIEETPAKKVSVVSYSSSANNWIQIPNAFFLELTNSAAESTDINERSWKNMLGLLSNWLNTAKPVRFARGAYLINLGTSWWLRNYFLSVRNAQAEFDIRYVPFVHDCIPVLMPEHCVSELSRDFRAWIRGVFAHASFFLCNSESTRSDLESVAKNMSGLVNLPTAVVRLDGDARIESPFSEAHSIETLKKYGLKAENFVLFVSTIESRKNHKLLFEAWLRLLQTLGPERVPKLVCVGNKGWKVDSTIAMLNNSAPLKRHVVIAHGVSDEELRALYKSCHFTVYPSLYEGWGLPVTESLSYGKPVICSNSSSLPEAGGNHVVYFDPRNSRELVERVTEFLTTPAVLNDANKKAQEFSPRSWRDIAYDLLERVDFGLSNKCAIDRRGQSSEISFGQLYILKEDISHSLTGSFPSGEHFRRGDGWSSLDDFGCWMQKPIAELAFARPATATECELSLLLCGLPLASAKSINVTVGWQGRVLEKVCIPAGNKRVARIVVLENDWPADGTLVVSLTSDAAEPLAPHTEGRDTRIAHGALIALMLSPRGDLMSRVAFLEHLLFLKV